MKINHSNIFRFVQNLSTGKILKSRKSYIRAAAGIWFKGSVEMSRIWNSLNIDTLTTLLIERFPINFALETEGQLTNKVLLSTRAATTSTD